MLYVLITILMFGVLIAVHELGHFATAKFFGVQVNEFAIGMGPALWKKQGKETLYSLRAIPVGGYCAMEGEDDQSDNPRAFSALTTWKKIVVLAAGAFMNFVVGFAICVGLMFQSAAFIVPTIAGIEAEFPNQGENGLMVGDRITKIDGEAVLLYSDFRMFLEEANGQPVDLVVERDGEKVKLENFPLALAEYPDENGELSLRYGLNFAVEEANLGNRLVNGWYTSVSFVRMVIMGLEDLITGTMGLKDMAGPVGIVDVVSDVGNNAPTVFDAVYSMAYFTALIAVNLAVMNLLPLPALDGGRIFFTLLNWATYGLFRRTIPEKYEGAVHLAGLALLLLLSAVVMVSDISKLF